jgi:hypothetical protein
VKINSFYRNTFLDRIKSLALAFLIGGVIVFTVLIESHFDFQSFILTNNPMRNYWIIVILGLVVLFYISSQVIIFNEVDIEVKNNLNPFRKNISIKTTQVTSIKILKWEKHPEISIDYLDNEKNKNYSTGVDLSGEELDELFVMLRNIGIDTELKR